MAEKQMHYLLPNNQGSEADLFEVFTDQFM